MAPSKLPQCGHENSDRVRARTSRVQEAAIAVLIAVVFFNFFVARERIGKREAPPGQGGVIIQDNLSPWATPNETIILGPSTKPEQTIISDGGITVKGTRSPFISSKSITVIRRDGQTVVYEDDRKTWEATDIDRMPLWLRERVEE